MEKVKTQHSCSPCEDITKLRDKIVLSQATQEQHACFLNRPKPTGNWQKFKLGQTDPPTGDICIL
jgi:hypothetical protein